MYLIKSTCRGVVESSNFEYGERFGIFEIVETYEEAIKVKQDFQEWEDDLHESQSFYDDDRIKKSHHILKLTCHDVDEHEKEYWEQFILLKVRSIDKEKHVMTTDELPHYGHGESK